MDDLKLGSLNGYEALVVIIVAVLAVVALLAVIVLSAIKAVKERKDAKEDEAENKFYAEYGITGEEMRLNQRLALLRAKLQNRKLVANELKSNPIQEPIAQEPAPIVEEPAPTQEEPAPVVEEPKPEPIVEPIPEHVKEEPKPEPIPEPIKEEPKPEPVKEPVKEEPAPVVEEPKKQGVDKPATKKIVKKKPDDWSKYDGPYEGYYYDPEDACYYEGEPSPALAKKLAAKDAELEALNANKDKKVVIKKVAPPFAALKTPKNIRQAPKKVEGFDESVIYGKYIIEHVDTAEGSQEWFYTLYDATGKDIYESSNYSTKEYCERAINRFKSHAIIGAFTIEAAEGKFFFVLKRKTYVHKGMPVATFEEASKYQSAVKKFAQTDIIREQ